MRIKYDGNVKLSEGMYSNQTGNLNMVPLGVVQYWVERNGGVNDASNYKNLVGNLVVSHKAWAEANLIAYSGLGIELKLNPSIVSQYSRIIAVGSPSLDGIENNFSSELVPSNISMHFNQGRWTDLFNWPIPDEKYTPTSYEKYTIEATVSQWSAYLGGYFLHGTVMFYGIK